MERLLGLHNVASHYYLFRACVEWFNIISFYLVRVAHSFLREGPLLFFSVSYPFDILGVRPIFV